MEIAGAVAVVTGASSGIGEAVAIDLARRGATVVGAARREAQLEATMDACRVHAPESFAVVADVGVARDCELLLARAKERLGRVDILVNNAGVSLRRHALATTPADVEHVLRVNYLGAVHTTMAALEDMVAQRRGAVVNITSVAGYLPNPKEAAYGASKAALSLWTHGLSVDLHGTGVHCAVVNPGPIATEIWEKDETPASYDGRLFPPRIVADAVAQAIERERHHVTAPRRYGAIGILYDLPGLGRMVRRGLIGFERRGERTRASR